MWINLTLVFGKEHRAKNIKAHVAEQEDQDLINQFAEEWAGKMSSKDTLEQVTMEYNKHELNETTEEPLSFIVNCKVPRSDHKVKVEETEYAILDEMSISEQVKWTSTQDYGWIEGETLMTTFAHVLPGSRSKEGDNDGVLKDDVLIQKH